MSRMPHFEPMRLARRPKPFDHSDWIYEIKFDGFRGLAYVEDGKCRLVSRRRHEYKSFDELRHSIAGAVQANAIMDGEIVCLDEAGRPRFYDLMFHRGDPYFYAFDLLWLNGQDLRDRPLLERKTLLRNLIVSPGRLLYSDHLERNGSGLFDQACRRDLEGIVAKWKHGRYVADNRRSSWVKIKNPNYSQAEGRADLFNPSERSKRALSRQSECRRNTREFQDFPKIVHNRTHAET